MSLIKYASLVCVCAPKLSLFLGLTSWAYPQSALASQNAISLGAGGGGRAAVESSEALTLNPATLLFTRGYNLTSHYQMSEKKEGSDITSLSRWSVNVTDNQRGNLFPAGVRYQSNQFRRTGSLAFEQELQQVWVGVGYSFSHRFGLGLTGNYFADESSDLLKPRSQAYGLTIGSIYSLSPELGLAVSVQEIPVGSNERGLMSNQFGVGTSYLYSSFLRARLDLESERDQSLGKPWISMGFESLLTSWFAFRAGGKWQPDSSVWRSTLGLGLVGPRLSMNYAYVTHSHETGGALHALDLILPLW
jgi:hypothetical protein